MRILVTADLHLRNDQPICRVDEDWLGFTQKALFSILDIANKNNVDQIHIVGDIFHRAKSPNRIVNIFLKFVLASKIPIYIMPGQHDLPMHNYDLVEESSYGIVESLAKQNFMNCHLLDNVVPFGDEEVTRHSDEYPILHMHQFVVKTTKDIPPNSNAIDALTIHNKYPSFDFIVIGDNHHGFHHRNIVVPGCLTIQAADLKDYDPSVAIIDTVQSTVEWVKVYNDKSMIVDNHLAKSKEIREELNVFVEALKTQKDTSLSFEDNVWTRLKNEDIPKNVEEEIKFFLENA